MSEQERRMMEIGRAIFTRVFAFIFLVMFVVGILVYFYISQQVDIKRYEIQANEYHSRSIRLALEIRDEVHHTEVWAHELVRRLLYDVDVVNLPRQFTLANKLNNLKILLEENTRIIIKLQNQYKGDRFKLTIVRLAREYERFNLYIENLKGNFDPVLFDKRANSFLVTVDQLQLLHDGKLTDLRKEIVQSQVRNDSYLTFTVAVGFLLLMWLVAGFILNIKKIIGKYQVVLSDLELSRENTETLLQSTDQGIYGIDIEGNCIFANKACMDLLGYQSVTELIGKNMHQLIHHSYENGDKYPVEHCKLGKAHRAGKQVRSDDEVFWCKDGSSIAVEYSSNPIIETGKITGSVVAFSDITERKRIENELASQYERLEVLVDARTRELKDAKNVAEKANLLKSEFMGRMSHELRTPMNAILGFGQLMEMEDLSDNQKSFNDEIMTAAKHLLHLIDEVLDLASIEAGKINLVFEDFAAVDAIQECVANMEPFAAEHGIDLSVEMGDCSDINLRMDRTRTKEVLLNLVSNAIKYNSDQGKVLINCEQVVGGRLRINVVDTGKGIDTEKQFMLFEPFNRLGEEYSETQGVGIGLSISKNLMELMGGAIGMQSVPSGGSVFWIECNIGHSISKEAADGGGGEVPLSLQGKILYVEDNPANMRLVENIFSSYGNANIITAPTAEMGIELARNESPDIILMDINLPGMDGYEALSRLRNYPQTKAIPVIAISAAARPRDIERGLAAGFQGYLTKPIQIPELLDTIERILKNIKTGTA